MTPLQSLKQILQEHLELCQESEDYKCALDDCIYSCYLSQLALEQHMERWLNGPYNYKYCLGIKFVNDQWNIIKEKEDERLF